MYDNLRILGLITARGGSKGLPRKNIIDCAGKPLINWTVEAGRGSRYIDEIVLSTDDQEIAETGKKAGANVPFIREGKLAEDKSLIHEVIHDTVEKLSDKGMIFDFVLLLQPTSPLRTKEHIDSAIEQYFKNRKYDDEMLVSVYKADPKVGWIMQKNKEGYIDFCLVSKKEGKRRQDLDTFYYPNGAIYLAPIKFFKDTFYTEKTQYYVMPEVASVDIDTREDLERAESYLRGAHES